MHYSNSTNRLYIIKHFRFSDHFGKYAILFTFWISLMFMPAFRLVKSLQGAFSQYGYKITDVDYERIFDFGAIVLILTCLSWLVFDMFHTKKRILTIHYRPKLLPIFSVRLIFVIMFALSLFSFSIGLSRMGSAGVELPFRLGGIITLLRIVFFPILFAAIVENYYLCKKKVPIEFFVLFFLWALLEVIVRLSKGALVSSFLNVSILMYIYYKPKLYTTLKYVVPILAIFLFLYPIVELMRSGDTNSLRESFSEASQMASDQNDNTILQPLNRTFMIPGLYAKDYQYVSQKSLFDFSKTTSILAWGGSARYQTFVIDGYPLGLAHSSGTTGLEDPLLMGGYGLCFIVITLLMLMASAIDAMTYKRMFSIHIALIILLWNMSNGQNISSLLDSVGLQYIFARILAIWVVYHLNFSKKSIKK